MIFDFFTRKDVHIGILAYWHNGLYTKIFSFLVQWFSEILAVLMGGNHLIVVQCVSFNSFRTSEAVFPKVNIYLALVVEVSFHRLIGKLP